MKTIILVLVFSYVFLLNGCWGPIDRELTVGSDAFRLRISQWPVFFMSYKYAIEYSKDQKLFKRAYTWTKEDPFPLEYFSLRVIDSEKAYFLTYTTFGVTLNGGEKWLIYKPWEVVKYPKGIPKAEISNDGVGEIFLPNEGTVSKKTMFTTKDYGVSWTFVGYD